MQEYRGDELLIEDLQRRLDEARDVPGAAEALLDLLVENGFQLPSLYLERGGRLRCLGARGYWQIFDGIPPGSGVIGSTYQSVEGRAIPDVTTEPHYIAAVDEVVAEVCVPICRGDRAIGALNVESTDRLPEAALETLERVAEMFARRVDDLGGPPRESPAQRLARYGSNLAGVATRGEIEAITLDAALDLSGMSSAVFLEHLVVGPVTVTARRGPLASAVDSLTRDGLGAVTSWVRKATSCYTFGDPAGREFPGGEVLRKSGIRTGIVLALLSRGERLGTLVLADARQVQPQSETVELLELLASQTASSLRTVLATEAVHDSERRFRTLAEHSSDVICLHHPNGSLAYVSPSSTTVLGRQPADMIGTDLFAACRPQEEEGLRREVECALREGGVVVYRCTIGTGEDRWFETTITPVRDGSYGAQSSTRDVTERRRAERRLAHQALHDSLTGLPNREQLLQRLDEVLGAGRELALLFTDLDGFKAVNDRFGHTAGDEMLRAVGRRMVAAARPNDMIARLGGDEFVMLCVDVADPLAAQVIAERLAARLSETFSLSVGTATIRASIGVALGNAQSHTPADLLADADAAMYRSKRPDVSRSTLA